MSRDEIVVGTRLDLGGLNAGISKMNVAIAAATAAASLYIAQGVKANEWLIESDTRLANIAEKVAKATEEQTNELRRLADETEKTTAVEAEAVKVGQSQLLSYGLSVESTKKLTKSMADLGVAQLGTNIEGRDLIDIANLLGKAYMGQAGALTRAGIVMTEEQKKILQFGTELEKVAELTKIVEQNYGGLAEAMRNTPQGNLKMLEHDLGAVQENITAGLLPVMGEAAKVISELINTTEISKDADLALEIWKVVGEGVGQLGKVAVGVGTSFELLGTKISQTMIETAAWFEENRGFFHQLMGTGISQKAIDEQAALGKIYAESLRQSAAGIDGELEDIVAKNANRIDVIEKGIQRVRSLTKAQQGAGSVSTGEGSEIGAGIGGTSTKEEKQKPYDSSWVDEQMKAAQAIDNAWREANTRIYDSTKTAASQIDDIWQEISDSVDSEVAKRTAEEEEIYNAKIQAALDTATTLINIGDMVADAATARDQKELDSWRTKEQAKIDAMNISAKRKKKLEDDLAAEAIKREQEIAKKRGRIEIASTWANAAASIAQTYANLIAAGAKFGGAGVTAAGITGAIAAATITAQATAQTAIIASQMNGFAAGGMVGNRNARATRGGDDQTATVRTGEMILNADQQKRLYDTIFGNGAGSGITINIGELTGDKLQELEDMLLKLKSYGRI